MGGEACLALTLEKVLSLAVEDTCPHLEILGFEKFGNFHSCRRRLGISLLCWSCHFRRFR